jgi:hypothetical protein
METTWADVVMMAVMIGGFCLMLWIIQRDTD